MADDDYESTDDTPATDAIKYYQVAVPNFTSQSTATGVPTVVADGAGNPTSTAIDAFSGSSFLRIGSSPSAADYASAPFKNSALLAKLVGDPTGIVAAEGITVAAGAVTSQAYDDSNATTLTTTQGSSSFVEAFADGAGSQSSTFGTHQDPAFLLGFADDVRNRGPLQVPDPAHAGQTIDNALRPSETMLHGAAVANSNQNRQAETLRLLTKGGWWDHSDGNRVTTTSGDKIEVIQGNYKLVVLGRQPIDDATKGSDVSGNAFITDVSGGHFQEQYPSPTPCIKTVEYVQDAGGEWTLYQDNAIGNLITKLKGRTVDLFQGSKREAYVGSDGASTDATGALDPQLIAGTWAQSVYSQTGSEDKMIGATSSSASSHSPLAAAPDGAVASKTWAKRVYSQTGSIATPVGGSASASAFPSSRPGDATGLDDGDVMSATWAQRILSYTGSSDKRVPYVYGETYAGEVKSVTDTTGANTSIVNAASISSTTTVTGDVTSTLLSSGNVSNTASAASAIQNLTQALAVGNITTAAAAVGNITAAGAGILNLNVGADLVNVNAGLSLVNLNLGIAMINIDLTPISIHTGFLATELAVQRSIVAAKVDLGADPEAISAGSAAGAVAKGAFAGLMVGGALGGLVGIKADAGRKT
ncbi:MAG TPA: hypothetical protein VGM56_25415 [Byssovorax sp.]|jgi:hypothetical protein